jgi:hypothetical protein
MLDRYLYDTSLVSEMQYKGPPMTIEQRREDMRSQLDKFDQQFGARTGETAYQQSYSYYGSWR